MITQKTIADDLGISTATLKNWVHALNLTPPRHRSGRTKYDQKFIEVLYKIKDLRDKGTGLQTIRELIQDNDHPNKPLQPVQPTQQIERIVTRQYQIEQELKVLKQRKICQLEQQNQRLLEEIIELHKELKTRPTLKLWEETQNQLETFRVKLEKIENKQNETIGQRILAWFKK